MGNDSKLGMVVGLAVVVGAALVVFPKKPVGPPEAATSAIQSRPNTPGALTTLSGQAEIRSASRPKVGP